MNNENQRNKIINSLIWKFAERISAQAITFAVSIILARLLDPSDYGVIAIVLVFMSIADVFATAGFGNALIQKKDADNIDFNSVFYFNICFSIIIYLVIYFSSSYISNFYNIPILKDALIVAALRIPIAAINSVQYAYISKNMQFKSFFYGTLAGTMFSAFIGIIMAYCGYGIWALIGQYLSHCIVNTIILSFVINWHPQIIFSFNRLKKLFHFGWKLLLSGLLDTGYNSCNSLLIGKFYTPADLAFFETGQKFPLVIVNNINTSISSVLFPALASEQDKPELIKLHIRKSIQISSYIMWPMMLGIAACADNIVNLVLTDKWLPAVPYLQIACITYGLWPIHTANLQAINAMGRSDIFLKLEIVKKVIGITALLISIQYGILVVAITYLITGMIATFINSYPNKFLLKYSYYEQIKDILPSFLLALIMCILIKILPIDGISILFGLVLKIIIGIIIYFSLSIIFKNEAFEYMAKIMKERFL